MCARRRSRRRGSRGTWSVRNGGSRTHHVNLHFGDDLVAAVFLREEAELGELVALAVDVWFRRAEAETLQLVVCRVRGPRLIEEAFAEQLRKAAAQRLA